LGQREAELQQHWRVDHAERKAQLKERLRQCKEDLLQGTTRLLLRGLGILNQANQSLESNKEEESL